MVWQLNDDLCFPDPYTGEPDGLVAVGGDLSPDRLLQAYLNGFFPWYAYAVSSMPHWYCPLKRFVIFPDEIHVSHSMRQLIRQKRYMVTINRDFEGVINACSTVQKRNEHDGAWLGPDMIEAYIRLFKEDRAASFEVWDPQDNRLVGGLYGVTMRKMFFGESMFSLVPNASKLALIELAQVMRNTGGKLIDCQFETPFFASMGGRYISYEEYMYIMNSDENMSPLGEDEQ